MINDITHAKDLWPTIAHQALERRLSVVMDILSTESLKIIASGEIDLATECKQIAQQVQTD